MTNVEKPKSYGEWAFLGGVLIAVLLGIGSSWIPEGMMPIVWAILAVLGLVVGLLNVTEKETIIFLVATMAMLTVPKALDKIVELISKMPAGAPVAIFINGFLGALVAFLAPAVFVVAIKAIYNLAKSE